LFTITALFLKMGSARLIKIGQTFAHHYTPVTLMDDS